jgi:hypothetical protein
MKLGQLFQQKAGGQASPAAANGDSDPIALVFAEIEKNVKADSSLVSKGSYNIAHEIDFPACFRSAFTNGLILQLMESINSTSEPSCGQLTSRTPPVEYSTARPKKQIAQSQ